MFNRTKTTAASLVALSALGLGASAFAGAAQTSHRVPVQPQTQARTKADRPTAGDVRDGSADRLTAGDKTDRKADRMTPGDKHDAAGDREQADGVDRDNVQSGDQTGSDSTAEQGSEVAGNDGPTGHADEAGSQGQSQSAR